MQQGATMQVGTESYSLQQLVLHADSETLIDGKRAPLEVRCCSARRGFYVQPSIVATTPVLFRLPRFIIVSLDRCNTVRIFWRLRACARARARYRRHGCLW